MYPPITTIDDVWARMKLGASLASFIKSHSYFVSDGGMELAKLG
jgi:hypothetical protein